jgi:4-carboxymuconolactone decarboxylase
MQDRPPLAHGRIPWPTPADLDDARRAVRQSVTGGLRDVEQAFALTDAEGRLHGPFNLMLAAPGPGLALSELGAALRSHASLSDRVREIAILTVSVLHRSSFVRYAHEAIARRIGMTEEELTALVALRPAASFDAVERTVQATVVGLVGRRDLDDAEFSAVAAMLGTEATVELILLTGYYELLAFSMRVLRTPLPAGVADPFAAIPDTQG